MYYRLNLASGDNVLVKSELPMLEVANEIRSKAKISVNLLDGSEKKLSSVDIVSIERVYRSSLPDEGDVV